MWLHVMPASPLSQVRPKLNKKPVKLVKLVALKSGTTIETIETKYVQPLQPLKPGTTRKPVKCDVAHYNLSQVTPVS